MKRVLPKRQLLSRRLRSMPIELRLWPRKKPSLMLNLKLKLKKPLLKLLPPRQEKKHPLKTAQKLQKRKKANKYFLHNIKNRGRFDCGFLFMCIPELEKFAYHFGSI
jgi:hypothetical protein